MKIWISKILSHTDKSTLQSLKIPSPLRVTSHLSVSSSDCRNPKRNVMLYRKLKDVRKAITLLAWNCCFTRDKCTKLTLSALFFRSSRFRYVEGGEFVLERFTGYCWGLFFCGSRPSSAYLLVVDPTRHGDNIIPFVVASRSSRVCGAVFGR